MRDVLLMTPGPTAINEEVRQAMSQRITNPDLDPQFYDFFKETCLALAELFNTKNEVLLLAGEGILGLEAACASLIEPGDRVLCLDNGVFGRGFGDFVTMYGGEAVYFEGAYDQPIDAESLAVFLEKDSDFKLATLVHCETPSGITNPIDKLCPLLKKYGILTVVDTVSGVGGEPLMVDAWQVDIALGGSQKALSAPPGLTFLSVSEDAWSMILNRKNPITGFYANLSIWRNWYEKQWFPYTPAISDVYALRKAVQIVAADSKHLERHQEIALAVRTALIRSGLTLYPLAGHSSTVTAAKVPADVNFATVWSKMLTEHQVMIAGSFGPFEGKIMRIGHMGENCYPEKVFRTLRALDTVLTELGFATKLPIHQAFVQSL